MNEKKLISKSFLPERFSGNLGGRLEPTGRLVPDATLVGAAFISVANISNIAIFAENLANMF